MKSWMRNTVVLSFMLLMQLICAAVLHAQAPLLPAAQAFPLKISSPTRQQIQLDWQIPKDYYLYQHKIELYQGSQLLKLALPPATTQHDDFFGNTQVYFNQLQLQFKPKALQQYRVSWQGCAKDRLCYPPQNISFQTDADGLIVNAGVNQGANDSANNSAKTLFAQSQGQSLLGQQSNTLNNTAQDPAANTINTEQSTSNNTLSSANSDTTTAQPATTASTANNSATPVLAQDQAFTAQLQQRSWGYTVLLFLGLGLLLAFSPCSLPMLPILSSLLVREHKGLKAWSIALVFVLSMATVYALLGLLASSAGLNFQRWLQQPITLMAFAGLFILFAANLFGLFELSLPQKLTHHLDRIQSVQRGGTLLGAAVMGVISALLVGPCMTAPLAGVLLFIAQTQNQLQGAVLLFSLGLGMGLPLLIAATLGAKVLPKAGDWMHQVKIIFGFLMLALALYFVRPLLPAMVMQVLSALLSLSFVVYALYHISKRPEQLRWLYVLLLLVVVPFSGYYQHLQWQDQQQAAGQGSTWQVAKTAAQYRELLANAPKDRAVVVDVYADWCVACQPIEHRILKRADVQQALADFYLIKLDLSHYDDSHQTLLNELQVLGPPTYLFLTADHAEQRNLRLTGAFQAQQLLQQLASLKAASAN